MWNNIVDELTRLARIADSWKSKEVPELEKDMVLKKLSAIYEQVKFGAIASDSVSEEECEVVEQELVEQKEEIVVEPVEDEKHIEQETVEETRLEEERVHSAMRDHNIIDSLYGSIKPHSERPFIENDGVENEKSLVEEQVQDELELIELEKKVVEIPDNIFDDIDLAILDEAIAEYSVDDDELDALDLELIDDKPQQHVVVEMQEEIEVEVEIETHQEVEPQEPEYQKRQPQEVPAIHKPHLAIGDESKKHKSIGETLHAHERTLADAYAENGKKHDMASKLGSSKVAGLRSAIGINDKFLMIKELFGGDSVAFDTAIANLEKFDELDDALIHIHETYAWNPNSEAVKLLMDLLARKLS